MDITWCRTSRWCHLRDLSWKDRRRKKPFETPVWNQRWFGWPTALLFRWFSSYFSHYINHHLLVWFFTSSQVSEKQIQSWEVPKRTIWSDENFCERWQPQVCASPWICWMPDLQPLATWRCHTGAMPVDVKDVPSFLRLHHVLHADHSDIASSFCYYSKLRIFSSSHIHWIISMWDIKLFIAHFVCICIAMRPLHCTKMMKSHYFLAFLGTIQFLSPKYWLW